MPTLPPDPSLLAGTRGEQVLWRAAAGEALEVDAILGARTGALLPPDAFLAIEVWVECELAALHALQRLVAADPERAAARTARLREAIAWHLEHTQPDNATNRPWALHAFLLADDGGGAAAFYAETLLQNALATEARDEPLSRWILADAARELRRSTSAGG